MEDILLIEDPSQASLDDEFRSSLGLENLQNGPPGQQRNPGTWVCANLSKAQISV